jgi:Zn-finger nucleic acid-binding protein
MAELGRPWALATGYDIAFLHLVMVALEESPVESLPCTVLPFRKLPVRRLSEPARRWLTAINILLIEEKCRDDVADDNAWKGRLGLKLMKKQAQRARGELLESGFPSEHITTLTERQGELERKSLTLEEYAIPTSLMLGEVFAHAAQLTGRPEMALPMKQLGQGLGCAIFIKDALDDLDKDGKRGRFNAIEKSLGSSYQRYVRTSLAREVRRTRSGLARLGMSNGEAAQILNQFAPKSVQRPAIRRRTTAGAFEFFVCLGSCCCEAGMHGALAGCCPGDLCCAAAVNAPKDKSNLVEKVSSASPLHCPACGEDLKPCLVGGVEIDECDNCRGLWLDHGELEVLANVASLPTRLTVKRRTIPTPQLRPEGTRPCPRCSKILVGTVVKGVRLDLCAECQGVWLDQGELNQILD